MSGSAEPSPKPVIEGFAGTWDASAGEWVYTRIGDPTRVLRGRDQAELEQSRWDLVFQMCDELRQISAYAATHSMTPPGPDWQPEPYTRSPSRRRSPPAAT